MLQKQLRDASYKVSGCYGTKCERMKFINCKVTGARRQRLF